MKKVTDSDLTAATETLHHILDEEGKAAILIAPASLK